MAIRFGSDEVPKTSPRTLDQEYAASIKPGPFQIGPDQEEVAEFIFSNLLKAANDTYQNANILGLSPETINEDILQPTYDKIKFAKEYWRDVVEDMKLGEMQDEDEYNVLKTFLAESGSDLLDAFVPESNLDLAMEVGEELVPYAKLFAFIPPAMLKKLTKAIDTDQFVKVVKQLASESPPIRKLLKLADGDVSVFEPLVRAARVEPHGRVHASGTRFTGDEIDMSHAGSGAGGDMMGQHFYQTQKASGVDKGYADDYDYWGFQVDPKRADYEAQARDEIEKALVANEILDGHGDLLKSENYYDIRIRQAVNDEVLKEEAVKLWKADNPDKGGQILDFTAQAGSIPYVTDQTRLTPAQKTAMFNAMPKVLRELEIPEESIEAIMEAVLKGPAAGSGSRTKFNPTGVIGTSDVNPDQFFEVVYNSLVGELGEQSARNISTKDILNRLRMEIGYDELDYPSGQIYTQAQGHRNYATMRPEILQETPILEPRIGREPVPLMSVSEKNFKEALDEVFIDLEVAEETLKENTPRFFHDGIYKFLNFEDLFTSRDLVVAEPHFMRDQAMDEWQRFARGYLEMPPDEARKLFDGWWDGEISADEAMTFMEKRFVDQTDKTARATGLQLPEEFEDLFGVVRRKMSTKRALQKDLLRIRGGQPEHGRISQTIRGRDIPPGPRPEAAVYEGLSHAGSAASVEAMNRQAAGVAYYRVNQAGDTVPLIGVDAVDITKAKPGEAIIQVNPDGSQVVVDGVVRGPNMENAAAMLEPGRVRNISDPDEVLLDLDAEEDDDAFLKALDILLKKPEDYY